MRLAVVGSRDFPDRRVVDAYLDCVKGDLELEIDCIVSGGARGVDQTAEAWAMRNYIALVSFRPVKSLCPGEYEVRRLMWPVYGQVFGESAVAVLPGTYPSFAAAAFVRNRFIVEFADQVVAFWHRDSHGTRDSIAKARSLGNLRDVISG